MKFTSPLGKTTFNQLAILCSYEKLTRLFRFRFWQDAHRTLLGELLLKLVLAKKTGRFPHEMSIESNRLGKPIAPEYPDLNFSLSHSGAWVVSAWDTGPIGIDIEKLKSIQNSRDKDFLSLIDTGPVQGLDMNLKIRYFFSLWTLRESLGKKTGRGLEPLFSRRLSSWERRIPPEADSYSYHDGDHHYWLYPIDPKYRMAVCSTNDRFPISLTVYSIEELIDSFDGYGL